MGALAQVATIVRNDAANLAARADAEEARTALIQHVCDKIAEFERRFDALTARLAAAEDKRRADEQAAREFEEPIEEPPGMEDNAPSGELHALPPSEKPEPSLELESDQTEFALPEPQDPTGTVIPQPTAISLNKE